ncbi:uncharacterized protein UV8b_08039 [Ustilaginoidea virens]|uniref:Uncharacterized protein n=1 Tax=Ustilaginoidea virens TaxID=1159556 RepID=A0A8E5HYT7_USTVR|nr:uncharacterized protein UV8b_08039 [Ustilaginoidea virens]QUC23798.1 hypothetical protein UV8b_08039 [Ustilaginoidea virens]
MAGAGCQFEEGARALTTVDNHPKVQAMAMIETLINPGATECYGVLRSATECYVRASQLKIQAESPS